MLTDMFHAADRLDECLTNLRMITRDEAELAEYMEAAADFVMCGVTPDQMRFIARDVARRDTLDTRASGTPGGGI